MLEGFEAVEAQGECAGFVGGGRLVDEQRLQAERVKERGDAINEVAEGNLFHVENAFHIGRVHGAGEEPTAAAGVEAGEEGRRSEVGSRRSEIDV